MHVELPIRTDRALLACLFYYLFYEKNKKVERHKLMITILFGCGRPLAAGSLARTMAFMNFSFCLFFN